jgi:hypothetical protein
MFISKNKYRQFKKKIRLDLNSEKLKRWFLTLYGVITMSHFCSSNTLISLRFFLTFDNFRTKKTMLLYQKIDSTRQVYLTYDQCNHRMSFPQIHTSTSITPDTKCKERII